LSAKNDLKASRVAPRDGGLQNNEDGRPNFLTRFSLNLEAQNDVSLGEASANDPVPSPWSVTGHKLSAFCTVTGNWASRAASLLLLISGLAGGHENFVTGNGPSAFWHINMYLRTPSLPHEGIHSKAFSCQCNSTHMPFG
jgi:hypothetical protein